jgi:SAM-dependent methyltransferase
VVADSVATYSDHVELFTAYSAHAATASFAALATRLAPESIVLDAGCGPGRDLARLAALGHRGIGLDLNPQFARHARDHAPLVVGDLRRVPFASASFDAVWASASLIHLPRPDAATALAEFKRVARAGAPVCLSVKVAGVTGWADDLPRGRRWFYIWVPAEFTGVVATAGFVVDQATQDRGWLTVWARA